MEAYICVWKPQRVQQLSVAFLCLKHRRHWVAEHVETPMISRHWCNRMFFLNRVLWYPMATRTGSTLAQAMAQCHQPMLIHHHSGVRVAFTWVQFHRNSNRYLCFLRVWKLLIQDYRASELMIKQRWKLGVFLQDTSFQWCSVCASQCVAANHIPMKYILIITDYFAHGILNKHVYDAVQIWARSHDITLRHQCKLIWWWFISITIQLDCNEWKKNIWLKQL